MEFGIEDVIGTLKGMVEVKKPGKVKFGLKCELYNDTVPDKIKLKDLKIEPDGLVTKLALKATGAEGKTRESLKDPNIAFMKFLDYQFKPKGVTLDKLGLHFNKNTLNISLSGKAIK